MIDVVVRFRHLDQFHGIGHGLFEALHPLDHAGDPPPFAHQFLRALGVVPKRRVFGFGVQFIEAAECDIPVKDASSAARLTA